MTRRDIEPEAKGEAKSIIESGGWGRAWAFLLHQGKGSISQFYLSSITGSDYRMVLLLQKTNRVTEHKTNRRDSTLK